MIPLRVLSLLLLLPAAPPLAAQATRRVDRALDGREPDAPLQARGVAGQGRYVLSESAASNLVPDDTNGTLDVFVHDLLLGTVERVSVASDGSQGNGESRRPTISADGRFVAFDSRASNLVSDDTNGDVDVFLHDRLLHTTQRVNLNGAGNQARRDSAWGSVSDDGRQVAFDSLARNLTTDDANQHNDVFVRDLANGRTTRLSRPFQGQVGGGSFFPGISGDGRFVVFHSIAGNLVANDTNDDWDVFIHDRDPDGNGIFDEDNGRTELLSVGSGGQQGLRASRDADIDFAGRHAAFWSESPNLVGGDTNSQLDVFVRDLQRGITTRISVDSAGIQGNGESRNVSLAADGRFVAFRSAADNLVPGDTNGQRDLFVHDRDPDRNGRFDEGNGHTRRVSLTSLGKEGDGDHTFVNLTRNGRYVVFQSSSRNFRQSPLEGQGIYIKDLMELRAEPGLERGTWGFELSHAYGQEGRPVWILLSCSPTKTGTEFGSHWLPLALDRCSSHLALRASIDADGRAMIPATDLALPGTLGPLAPVAAAALVLQPDATGVRPVSTPVRLGARASAPTRGLRKTPRPLPQQPERARR